MRAMVVLFVVGMMLGLALLGCNQLNPPQIECAQSKGGCRPCVERYCYWDSDRGSCWSKAEVPSTNPVGFVQDCNDGTAPFPDPVVNPMPYALGRDAGVRDLR